MDVKKSKHNINSYILYKHENGWYEGRLKSIVMNDGKEIFHIFSLYSFTDIVIHSAEHIASPTVELRKKLRVTAFSDIPNRVHIPPRLKNVLIVDREWSCDNQYDFPPRVTVSMVITQFRTFLTTSALVGDPDEIIEVAIGFARLFDSFLPRFLLYGREKEQCLMLGGPLIEQYGPVYLLRLLYFIQKKGKAYVGNKSVEMVVMDYTIYMLDFLLLRYKDFF